MQLAGALLKEYAEASRKEYMKKYRQDRRLKGTCFLSLSFLMFFSFHLNIKMA